MNKITKYCRTTDEIEIIKFCIEDNFNKCPKHSESLVHFQFAYF